MCEDIYEGRRIIMTRVAGERTRKLYRHGAFGRSDPEEE
jgi:hypothetical protein